MPIQKLRPSFTFDEERLDQLRDVVPEAFADGKVNWDVLKEALGEHLEDEDADVERFGLFWPGKREARRLASRPSKGALVPQPGRGVDEETTQNLFIEGDNLEVLKLLQKSYAGRVKMIYIDPPYNTGNDFVYPDDYSEPLGTYLHRTNQADEDGQLLTTNARTSGRFHSNWLNMIYPRLRLARQILRDDGLIFVSIDDNEMHHLRMLMNEIFGEENFLAAIAWEKRFTRSNNAKLFYSVKDSILLYRKSDAVSFLREPRTEKSDSIYGNPDNDPRGPWTSASYVNPATKEQRPNLVYSITNPFTGEKVEHPTHAWKYGYSEHLRHVKENLLWWGSDKDATYPRIKIFLSESEGLVPIDLWDYKTSGTTDDGGMQVKSLFGEAVFDNPKPTQLIRRMIYIATRTEDDCLIVDFFAGSCSTAQSVLEFNRNNNSRHRFIMVQLPEPTPEKSLARKAGYHTIAEIGRERIRRVIAQMEAETEDQLDLRPNEDLGFKSYRLDRSNFKAWRDYEGDDVAQLATLFDEFESPLVEGWQTEDLIAEILLTQGFPLDSRVTFQEGFAHNQVRLVTSDFHEHRLLICLDETIAPETISQLDLQDQDVFVCLDTALTDEAKVRLADSGNIHVI